MIVFNSKTLKTLEDLSISDICCYSVASIPSCPLSFTSCCIFISGGRLGASSVASAADINQEEHEANGRKLFYPDIFLH